MCQIYIVPVYFLLFLKHCFTTYGQMLQGDLRGLGASPKALPSRSTSPPHPPPPTPTPPPQPQPQGRRLQRDFEVADVKKPILGADFLTANRLVVDLQQGVITSNEDQHLLLPCSLHGFSSKGEFSINQIQHILEGEFRDVAGYELFQLPPPAS